jgi:hypothetical protein
MRPAAWPRDPALRRRSMVDEEDQIWRNGRGRSLPRLALVNDTIAVRTTKVVLATAHLDHDPTNQPTAKPESPLPAVPYDPRPCRAPSATLDHATDAQGNRRSFPGSLPHVAAEGKTFPCVNPDKVRRQRCWTIERPWTRNSSTGFTKVTSSRSFGRLLRAGPNALLLCVSGAPTPVSHSRGN